MKKILLIIFIFSFILPGKSQTNKLKFFWSANIYFPSDNGFDAYIWPFRKKSYLEKFPLDFGIGPTVGLAYNHKDSTGNVSPYIKLSYTLFHDGSMTVFKYNAVGPSLGLYYTIYRKSDFLIKVSADAGVCYINKTFNFKNDTPDFNNFKNKWPPAYSFGITIAYKINHCCPKKN